MKRSLMALVSIGLVMVAVTGASQADVFGTGANQFSIDFVGISNATNLTSGVGSVSYAYRMGTYEITNDQWIKFKAAYGTVTGAGGGYGSNSPFTGLNQPTGNVSWYEAAQFVNYLNDCGGTSRAYNFTGVQGTNNYTFASWAPGDVGYDAANPFRNKNAQYVLPTESEWVKAAYWNGTTIQQYATKAGQSLTQAGWNYVSSTWAYAETSKSVWDVGHGSQELNGTYDMMGNLWEWTETPGLDYIGTIGRGLRGGYYADCVDYQTMESSLRTFAPLPGEGGSKGFRVAAIPEPATMSLLALGGIAALIRRRRRA